MAVEFQRAGLEGRLIEVPGKNNPARQKYVGKAEHTDLNEFIGDYQTIQALLKKEYGQPVTDRAIWTDDTYQDEPKSYLDQDRATASGIFKSDRFVGLSVSMGHLKLYTVWRQGGLEILHTLTGADGHVTHEIEFAVAKENQ